MAREKLSEVERVALIAALREQEAVQGVLGRIVEDLLARRSLSRETSVKPVDLQNGIVDFIEPPAPAKAREPIDVPFKVIQGGPHDEPN